MPRRLLGAGLAALTLVALAGVAGAAPAPGTGTGPPAPGGPDVGEGGEPVADPAPTPVQPAVPPPGDGGEARGDREPPVEVSAEAEPDGSANASLRAEAGSQEEAYPGAGTSAFRPRPESSAEAGAVTFPDPDGRCRETPLARLYVVAAPGVAVASADGPPTERRRRLEDPRDHPAWRCTFGGSAGEMEATGSPAAAPEPADPLLAVEVGAPSPGSEPREGQPTSDEPGERTRDGARSGPVDVDAAARRQPVGGGLAAGVATLALAALAVPAAVALYRRLSRDDLLENETRQALLEMVRERPGLTAAEASERLDVHYGTARHHLDLLAEFGEVEAMELNGRIRYFENHERFGRIAKHLLSCLDSETKRAVLMEIARSGALRSGEVADEVGVAPSTASYHLGDMEELGLLEAREEGRSVLYSLEDGVLPALLELAPGPGDERQTRG